MAPLPARTWHWLPASGHSGGILLGAKEDTFEIEDMDSGDFFVSMSLTHRRSSFRWEVIIVYGPADHSRSPAFLLELKSKVERCSSPVVVAGDFNLIRSSDDKSSSNVDVPRMRMFNDCIADLALREIPRVGARYTWSNNRVDPVRSVLDRVLVSVEWEVEYPLSPFVRSLGLGRTTPPSFSLPGVAPLPARTASILRTSGLVSQVFRKLFELDGLLPLPPPPLESSVR